MSSVLSNLGQLHIVTGLITVTSGTWTLTSNDGSASLNDIGAGNVSVTFGEAFLSAPACTANVIKATHSATLQHSVTIEVLSTTTVEFRHLLASTEAAAGNVEDPANGDGWSFIAVGLRNV